MSFINQVEEFQLDFFKDQDKLLQCRQDFFFKFYNTSCLRYGGIKYMRGKSIYTLQANLLQTRYIFNCSKEFVFFNINDIDQCVLHILHVIYYNDVHVESEQ